MFRTIFLLSASIIFFCSNINIAQVSSSFQINGGIISPMSSSNGLSGTVQLSFPLSKKLNFYIFSGYAAWDKFKITFYEEMTKVQRKTMFSAYSADNHILIPVYVGGKIDMHRTELFTSFLTAEIGYSYLSYNSYSHQKVRSPETGAVDNYAIAGSSEIKEDLIGIGIGAGISHPMTEDVSLIFSFKLNSYINSNYYGLFSTRGTYTVFSAGFNLDI